jgi:hypothetical protein
MRTPPKAASCMLILQSPLHLRCSQQRCRSIIQPRRKAAAWIWYCQLTGKVSHVYARRRLHVAYILCCKTACWWHMAASADHRGTDRLNALQSNIAIRASFYYARVRLQVLHVCKIKSSTCSAAARASNAPDSKMQSALVAPASLVQISSMRCTRQSSAVSYWRHEIWPCLWQLHPAKSMHELSICMMPLTAT